MINFNPFPVFETERLLLRRIEDDDAVTLLQLRTDNIVNKFIDRDKPGNVEDVMAFMHKIWDNATANASIMWGICLKENTDTLIGTICLWNFSEDRTIAEIGYEMLPAYHGKGYMNEALQQVLNFGFYTAGFSLIEAFTHRENERSIRLLKKNGFSHVLNRLDEQNMNNVILSLAAGT